jgi:hypothetical protein
LFALSILAPWVIPERGDPVFLWTIFERADPSDRVLILFLPGTALAILCAAALPLRDVTRAIVAALFGVAGLAIWCLVDPPPLLTSWAPGWRLKLLTVVLIALPPSLFLRARIASSIGLAGIVALFFVPSDGATLAGRLGVSLANTDPLTWQQTAALVWMMVLLACAAAALAVWLPSTRLITRAAGWLLVGWLAVFVTLSQLRFVQAGRPVQPGLIYNPLHLVAYAALSAWGIVIVARHVMDRNQPLRAR